MKYKDKVCIHQTDSNKKETLARRRRSSRAVDKTCIHQTDQKSVKNFELDKMCIHQTKTWDHR